MTKLVLEIPNQSVLQELIPMLQRLRIRFSKIEVIEKQKVSIEDSIRIVKQGCDMNNFDDALAYQIETRADLPKKLLAQPI